MKYRLTDEEKVDIIGRWKWGKLDTTDLNSYVKSSIVELARDMGIIVNTSIKIDDLISLIDQEQKKNVERSIVKMNESMSIQLVNKTLPTAIIVKILLHAWFIVSWSKEGYKHMMINKSIYKSIILQFNYWSIRSNLHESPFHIYPLYFTNNARFDSWARWCDKNPMFAIALGHTVRLSLGVFKDILLNDSKQDYVTNKIQQIQDLTIIDNSVGKEQFTITPTHASYLPNITTIELRDFNSKYLIEYVINSIPTIRYIKIIYIKRPFPVSVDSSKAEELQITIKHPIFSIDSPDKFVYNIMDEFKPLVSRLNCSVPLDSIDSLQLYTGLKSMSSRLLHSSLFSGTTPTITFPTVRELDVYLGVDHRQLRHLPSRITSALPNLTTISMDCTIPLMNFESQYDITWFKFLFNTKSITSLYIGEMDNDYKLPLLLIGFHENAGLFRPHIYRRIHEVVEKSIIKTREEMQAMTVPQLEKYALTTLFLDKRNLGNTKVSIIESTLDLLRPIKNLNYELFNIIDLYF